VVGIAGGHITSQNSRGVVAVEAGHREVRDQDVHRAIDRGARGERSLGAAHRPRPAQQFTIDGQEGVRDAIGMAGNRLEVDAHIITVPTPQSRTSSRSCTKQGSTSTTWCCRCSRPLEAVVTEDEIERGVVVVDVGGGTSDIAVFARGSIVHTSVIPVGGNHVTADLAVGLRCDLETLKQSSGTSVTACS